MARTIYNYEMAVYRDYALRSMMIEELTKQYPLDKPTIVHPQTQVLDTFPKLSELDLLLGVSVMGLPWAYFFPPKKFRRIRRSPFQFSRITPSLGSLEEQEVLLSNLEEHESDDPKEAYEKECLASCLREIGKINDWLEFIVGRMGQFLQG